MCVSVTSSHTYDFAFELAISTFSANARPDPTTAATAHETKLFFVMNNAARWSTALCAPPAAGIAF